MRLRTYYRGPDAVVTDELFTWRTTPARIFVIRDIRNVGIVRGGADRRRPHAAGGALAPAAAGWMPHTPLWYATAVLVTAAAGGAAGYRVRRSRRWELHATYRGNEVVLYAATDARVFNQVSRALRRAMEDARLLAA
jgi:Family of unknown function (DUF6232)